MARLLFIKASPRENESRSTQIANAYLDTLKARHPDLELDTIDLWKADLPAFDGSKVAAKMNVLGGTDHSPAERNAWEQVLAVANRFVAADRYLFSAPMWNGGIPYRLKQFIDIVHQPGVTFGLTADEGYSGLLKGKHATLVVTAGAYAPEFPSPQFGIDHQTAYLRAWLNQAGVTDIDVVRFQPTILTRDPVGDLQKAKEHAIHLAGQHRIG